ncbi:hypothetical protein GP486_008186, partial [Trichoglossum hirsutum]
MASTEKLYVVEHLDPELGPWSKLEYLSIAEESYAAGSGFCLSSISSLLQLPRELQEAPGLRIETRGVETFLADERKKVCLLDPSAAKELSPEDGDLFDIFLFGGILDFPELRINKHERIEMPFRYVKGEDGQPVMPQ